MSDILKWIKPRLG